MKRKRPIKSLYYITHIENILSILEHGILSHTLVEERHIPFTPIYDTKIVSHRRDKYAPDGNSLWDFANLYFQPRNPMLYRVINEKNKNDIVIFGVRPDILDRPETFVTTGNAANNATDILSSGEGLKKIVEMWDTINNEWWKEEDGSKRKIMAEALIPDVVPADYIHTIFVASHAVATKVKEMISHTTVPIVPEPQMFFLPLSTRRINNKLTLVEGDMFFSQMQTLTISVNTVGVMGKGLASRTKYQFPDVYVFYQDLCREKILQMGKPYLYKRESSLDTELAADPFTLPNINANKWFLLFPTKKHWKEGSDIAGIEQGLEWFQEHYKTEEIQSLAMPALGCGLGGLNWQDVGPLMCRYLAYLDIQVSIYLPREQAIPRELLTRDFLLGRSESEEPKIS